MTTIAGASNSFCSYKHLTSVELIRMLDKPRLDKLGVKLDRIDTIEIT